MLTLWRAPLSVTASHRPESVKLIKMFFFFLDDDRLFRQPRVHCECGKLASNILIIICYCQDYLSIVSLHSTYVWYGEHSRPSNKVG